MLGIIALVIIALVVAVSVLSFTVHFLFTPLVLVALGVLAWIKFRPRRSHE
jgi:threonine/homoserine/homoserine lactone efflux protein